MKTTGKPLPSSTIRWLRTVCDADAVLNSACMLSGLLRLHRTDWSIPVRDKPLQAVSHQFTDAE